MFGIFHNFFRFHLLLNQYISLMFYKESLTDY